MSSDALGLLEAIRDAPDDDLPRLAYADWLDERGEQPRAAFIRAQIQRARLPADDDRQSELQAAERRLLIEHGLDWLPSEVPITSVRFRRGFVEDVGGTARHLREGWPTWKGWPVRRLTLECDDPQDADWLRQQPWLSRVESLHLGTPGPAAEVVLRSPHLSGLREIVAVEPNVGALLDALEQRTLAERLESLGLGAEGCDDLYLDRLLSLSWPRLRRFDFGRSFFSAHGMRHLLYSGLWTRLDEIDLSASATDAVERAVLARGLECMRASRLALPYFGAGLDVMGALSDAGGWGRLTDLLLYDRATSRRSLERFLAHPGVARLTRLDLDASVADLMLLSGCAALSGLRWLTLPHNNQGVTVLARSPHLAELRGFGGAGPEEDCRAFLLSPAAAHLRWLSVVNMRDPVAGVLAESPHLKRLTTLAGAFGSTFSPATARALAQSPGLPCLTWVKLGICTADAARAFLEAPRLAWVEMADLSRRDDLAPLVQARYGGVNWRLCLDDR